MQHCIKCAKQYDTDDPEPYYCGDCLKTKKQIAAEIDAKFANRASKPMKSALQEYDELAKRGQAGFPRASDLL